jgi:hypothetical protein
MCQSMGRCVGQTQPDTCCQQTSITRPEFGARCQTNGSQQMRVDVANAASGSDRPSHLRFVCFGIAAGADLNCIPQLEIFEVQAEPRYLRQSLIYLVTYYEIQ